MYSEKDSTAANVLKMERYVQYLIAVRILPQNPIFDDGLESMCRFQYCLFSARSLEAHYESSLRYSTVVHDQGDVKLEHRSDETSLLRT